MTAALAYILLHCSIFWPLTWQMLSFALPIWVCQMHDISNWAVPLMAVSVSSTSLIPNCRKEDCITVSQRFTSVSSLQNTPFTISLPQIHAHMQPVLSDFPMFQQIHWNYFQKQEYRSSNSSSSRGSAIFPRLWHCDSTNELVEDGCSKRSRSLLERG